MIAERLLDRLESVRESGPGRWIARCPAHDDKTPSLAIRDVDGKLLLHCFAECSLHEIVSAVGLELSDLFPEKPKSHKPISRPIPAADILSCLTLESTFLALCAEAMLRGEKLQECDRNRLQLSAARCHAALNAGGLI